MRASQPDEVKDFLLPRQQQARAIDWGERRRQWIDAVEQLYRRVTRELLAGSIAQGLVTVSRAKNEIKEEYLGSYHVPELVLDMNGETARFSPKGRKIMGVEWARRSGW